MKNKYFNSILLLLTIIIPFFTLFYNSPYSWLLLIPCLVIEIYFFRNQFQLFSVSFFWVIFFIGICISLPWPFSFLAPLLIYFIIFGFSKPVRDETTWLKIGRFNKITLLLMIPTIVLSSIGLTLWFIFSKPDVGDLTKMLPHNNIILIIIAGVLFSIFNTICEEFILRGILWNELEMIFINLILINIIQSVFFGLIHYHGFPRGISGMMLAGIYGFFIGLIRSASGGMLAPVVTHIFADMTIYFLLLSA